MKINFSALKFWKLGSVDIFIFSVISTPPKAGEKSRKNGISRPKNGLEMTERMKCQQNLETCLKWGRGLPWVFLFLLIPALGRAAMKDETLQKYERVISKSNELNLYGYDLKQVTLKLKQMTDYLLNDNDRDATRMLDEIQGELEKIEQKGPEHLRRERELAWLEIYGDFVRQFAIFVVLSFLILRFGCVKRNLAVSNPPGPDTWKMILVFTLAAAFSGTLSFIRYDQSSWAFIDLQVLLVAAGGLLGGLWVGFFAGVLNFLLRYMMVPEMNLNILYPCVAGTVAGLCCSEISYISIPKCRWQRSEDETADPI